MHAVLDFVPAFKEILSRSREPIRGLDKFIFRGLLSIAESNLLFRFCLSHLRLRSFFLFLGLRRVEGVLRFLRDVRPSVTPVLERGVRLSFGQDQRFHQWIYVEGVHLRALALRGCIVVVEVVHWVRFRLDDWSSLEFKLPLRNSVALLGCSAVGERSLNPH